MRISRTAMNLARWALVPVLATAVGLAVAQGQDNDHGHGHGHDDDHYDQGNGHGHGNDNHGHDHYDNGRGHAYGREKHGEDFHFHGGDREHFERYYSRDVDHWRHYPHGRPHFYAGYYIPPTYAIQAVPPAYYAGMAPPPPGYAYGYYGGYVVAYNPTTRIISDVIDLVGTVAATHR